MTKTMRAEAASTGPEPRMPARNKERMSNAAVNLFAAKGFHGTPMEEIAQASGLLKANVYYCFSTKGSIYTALIERLIEGCDLAFEHIVPERERRDAIAAYIRAKLKYSRRHAAGSLKKYEAEGLYIQKRHLGRFAGLYASEIGRLHRVVLIWAYESLANSEQRRAAMSAVPA